MLLHGMFLRNGRQIDALFFANRIICMLTRWKCNALEIQGGTDEIIKTANGQMVMLLLTTFLSLWAIRVGISRVAAPRHISHA